MKNTGGPAFPGEYKKIVGEFPQVQIGVGQFVDGGPIFETVSTTGMTLRDYFAAKAMQGMIADGSFFEYSDESYRPGYGEAAEKAYKIADAMIDARGK